MRLNPFLASAILGILGGAACGGAQPPAAQPTALPSADKDGCGSHPAGSCSSPNGPKMAASAAAPLALERTETVRPGEHVEISLSFATASLVKAAFQASAPLGWNVHSHAGGEMTVHQKGAGASGEIAFQPAAPGTYSFLWSNDGPTPVTLNLKIAGDGGVTERRR